MKFPISLNAEIAGVHEARECRQKGTEGSWPGCVPVPNKAEDVEG